MSLIPSANLCCSTCEEPTTVAVPGPAGANGTNGTNGVDGVNAFTTTTAQFTMPAEQANVTISVVTSAPFAVGQIIYVKSGGASGYFEVISKPSTVSLEIKNLENTATSVYLTNSAPGVVFANGGSVSPGGLQGPAGANGTNGTNGTNANGLGGSGSPEGVVTSVVYQTYWDVTNKVLYIKDSGSGNTGWREILA